MYQLIHRLITTTITIQAQVKAPVNKVWDYWTNPEHITRWNQASPDWHCPSATNNVIPGGTFSIRMEAKDGSFGFDFEGTYHTVKQHQEIGYRLTDNRNVQVLFSEQNGETNITSTFDAEDMNPVEMQQAGWQAILNNFKSYTEAT